MCRLKQVQNVSQHNNADVNSESDDEFFVNSINVQRTKSVCSTSSTKEWTKTIFVEGTNVNFKLDTGSEVNVLPVKIYKILSAKNSNLILNKCNVVLEAFGGSKVKPDGSLMLQCSSDGEDHTLEFLIVSSKHIRPLLGIDACVKLNLIQFINKVEISNKGKLDQYTIVLPPSKDQFVINNSEVFEGVGKFSGLCKIVVDDQIAPVVRPPRRVPLSLKPKLELKLSELERQGIIAKVDQPLNWVSNLVIIEKANGSLRICLDPQDLNKAIKREHVLIPTIEEILPKLCNKSIYSVLDLKDGFFQIALDEDSSDLCTFSTPFGCYKFLRLPMGISCAPEIFQKRNLENFGNIPGVLVYFDDILIAASTVQEHDKILTEVINRAKKLNIKFNKQKLQYRVSEVKYLGHLFNASGMRPDPDRIKAITELQEPQNKHELQRVLGMCNYLRKFVPHFSEKTAILRELLKNKVGWQWLQLHSKAFKELKELISNAPVLGIFDSSKPITIQADSSKDGLGCCLLQNGQPIAFSSRSLNNAEKNYAQIEKEFLSILFAVNKFHYYIYGREVEVLTDHKPLVSIMNKNIANVLSNRLQRIKIKLLKYNLKLKYLPGKYMYIADLLSRSFIDTHTNENMDMTEIVHTLTKQLQMSESKKREFQKATLEDKGLMLVKEYWKNGWPLSVDKIPKEARSYFKCKNELSVEQDLVFFNNRIVVPVALRKCMLTLLHEAHCGIEKSKARARQVLFWPGINSDIENMISKCLICDRFRPQTVKEPLVSHEIPSLPYEKVGADICEYAGKSYLVIGCYLTKWVDIIPLKNKSAVEVTSKLKSIFATHGIPKTLICDNVPFNSWKMKSFARDWGFDIITSSPRYPKSNGFAEKLVGIAKSLFRKAGLEKLNEALLEYRNTPIPGINLSPSQLLLCRNLRTRLPITQTELKPTVQDQYREKLSSKQKQAKIYYDKHARERPEFIPGEKVMLRWENKWEPAIVLKKHSTPRSYWIRTKDNRVIRRNKFHLRKTKNEKNLVTLDYYDLGKENEENISSEHPKLHNDPHHQDDSNNINRDCVYKTRSGRNVYRPSKYMNYVMH
ncbi:Retrovirus-related Pol polyprotein from transposon 17.6, partial [Stegodyphus mimosarum]